jgi:CheY-like chemotaxis protein
MGDILILDHNRLTRAILRTVIGSAGYTLLETDNCEDALDMVLAHQPRVVIAGLDLPRLDGIAFAQRMRLLPFIQVPHLIFTTDRISRPLIDVGQRAVLSKPFDQQQLLDLIGDLLGAPAASAQGAPGVPAVLRERAVGE